MIMLEKASKQSPLLEKSVCMAQSAGATMLQNIRIHAHIRASSGLDAMH